MAHTFSCSADAPLVRTTGGSVRGYRFDGLDILRASLTQGQALPRAGASCVGRRAGRHQLRLCLPFAGNAQLTAKCWCPTAIG